jgi:hypothetical protein
MRGYAQTVVCFKKPRVAPAVNSTLPQFRILKARTRDELAQMLATAQADGWKPVGTPSHARPIFNESFHPFYYQPAIRHVALPTAPFPPHHNVSHSA